MHANAIYTLLLVAFFAVAAGFVGCFALMKRMLLASDVMSHLALPGLGVAFLWKINPLIGGAASLFLGTLLVWQLQKKTAMATDATIGVVFAGALAVGALVTPGEDLLEALFGNFQPLPLSSFLLGLGAVSVVIAFVLLAKERLALVLFSPELAATTEINVERLNLYFLLAFSLTVLVGLRFMGALLSSALIIIPAAIGQQLTDRMSHFLIVSGVASVFSVVAGFFISAYVLNTSKVGPAIVIVSVSLFCLSLLTKVRGK